MDDVTLGRNGPDAETWRLHNHRDATATYALYFLEYIYVFLRQTVVMHMSSSSFALSLW